MRSRIVLAAVTLTAVVGACAAPQPAASPTLHPSLGEPAEAIPGDPTAGAGASGEQTPRQGASAEAPPPSVDVERPGSPAPDTTGAEDPGPAGSAPPAGTGAPGTSPEPDPEPTPEDSQPAAPPRSFRLVGSFEDASGDHGLEGPGYADIRRVTIEDDGESARIRVRVGGELPTPPADGEVIGVGVNLLRQDSGESRYQLFADGGSDGWVAFLQTPDGFVAYPGEFRVGGDLVEFVIPWGALGSPSNGPFSAFLDWSRERPVVNAAAEDRAPGSGDASFDRR